MTLAVWMVHVLFAGLLVTLAALALDQTAALLVRPRRWIWVGAAALSFLLPVLTMLPRDVSSGAVTTPAADAESAAPPVWLDLEASASPGWSHRVRLEMGDAFHRTGEIARATQAAVASRVPDGPVLSGIVLVVWAVLSLSIAAFLFASLVALRRARRSWARAVLDGCGVRISDGVGPGVVGVASPEIVLPRWALGLDEATLRIVLHHEREHVSARDTLLLATVLLLVVLMPWNLPLLYQLRRVRGCVELDCDRRVLGRGVPASAYGPALLRVATLCHAYRIPAVALAESPTFLERRLKEMKPNRMRFRHALAAGASLAGVSLLGLACGLDRPTSPADVESDQAASVGALQPEYTARDSLGVMIVEARDSAGQTKVLGALAETRDQRGSIGTMRDVPPEVEIPPPPEQADQVAIDQNLTVLRDRIDQFGVTSPDIPVPLRGQAILIRRADGTLVPGVFRGPSKMFDQLFGGSRIVDEGISPRVHRVTEAPVGNPILIRRADGTIVHGTFRGPSKLADVAAGESRIIDEGTTSRARVLQMTGG